MKDQTYAGQRGKSRGKLISPTMLAAVVFGPLILTTFFAKLGVPVGPREVPASLYLIIAVLAIGLITSTLVVDIKKLAFFLITVCLLGGVQVYRGDNWSVPSFFMMVAIYATYTVSIVDKRFDLHYAMKVFLNVALIIAIGGIVQFFAQFVIGPQLAFPIDYLIPKSLLVEGYLNLNVLHYGSTTHKPNGIFLLEASFFSQLLAIAVLAELLSANRPGRLAIYLLGMVVSYSGTGIMILLATMPILIITKRRYDLIMLGILGLVLAGVFYEALNLELFVTRATEFQSTQSSGFMRFVGAYYLFDQFLWDDPLRALLGHGAGMFDSFAERANMPVHDSALSKIIFEFGLLGAIVNIGFLFFCLSGSSAPGILKMGVAVMFFMAGIYTPSSHGIALSLLMWPSPAAKPIESVRRSHSVLQWLGLDFERSRTHARRRVSKRSSSDQIDAVTQTVTQS